MLQGLEVARAWQAQGPGAASALCSSPIGVVALHEGGARLLDGTTVCELPGAAGPAAAAPSGVMAVGASEPGALLLLAPGAPPRSVPIEGCGATATAIAAQEAADVIAVASGR